MYANFIHVCKLYTCMQTGTATLREQSLLQTKIGICISYDLVLLLLDITLKKISHQFSSVAQSCLTLCNPMNHSMAGLPVHHKLPECTQTHAHQVSDAIQPSHPLSSPSPPASNLSQHQGHFQCVNSSHEVAKVLEFQLQHQSFQ